MREAARGAAAEHEAERRPVDHADQAVEVGCHAAAQVQVEIQLPVLEPGLRSGDRRRLPGVHEDERLARHRPAGGIEHLRFPGPSGGGARRVADQQHEVCVPQCEIGPGRRAGVRDV